MFGLSQPDISKLLAGDIDGYSITRLLRFVKLTGVDIHISFKRSEGSTLGKIKVV